MTESDKIISLYFIFKLQPVRSQDDSVGTVTRLGTGRPKVRDSAVCREKKLSPERPDRLWDTPSLIFSGYWRVFLLEKRLGRETYL